MRKAIFALATIATLAGCTTPPQVAVPDPNAAAAAAAAAVGGAATATSAKVGPASRPGWCTYRNTNGVLYESKC